MAERTAIAVERRSARAIAIDDEGRLVLIKRSKPGQEPYWTTAGGGVEDSDASIEAAMHRELFEELGAQVSGASQVFLSSFRSATGLHVHHFFVTRLVRLDPALYREAPSGPTTGLSATPATLIGEAAGQDRGGRPGFPR